MSGYIVEKRTLLIETMVYEGNNVDEVLNVAKNPNNSYSYSSVYLKGKSVIKEETSIEVKSTERVL